MKRTTLRDRIAGKIIASKLIKWLDTSGCLFAFILIITTFAYISWKL